MSAIRLDDATLDECVAVSGDDHNAVVVTRNGAPLAVVISIAGIDPEHVELGLDGEFWQMIQRRRHQPSVTRAELEAMLAADDSESPSI